MKSKISFFNRTLFKKNLTRFWPFAVLYALLLILLHPLVLHVELDYYEGAADINSVAYHFRNFTEPFSVAVVAIVVAMALFGYLYQSRSANMLHAFPVTRKELFVTNYLSGLALMALPQLFAALAVNLVILGEANSMIWAVWAWFGITFGYTVFFFGFACFIVMFTGQLLAAALFYVIWNFLYIVVAGLIDVVTSLLVFGLNDEVIHFGSHPLFPLAWLWNRVGFEISYTAYDFSRVAVKLSVTGIPSLVVYALVGLLFAAAALYVYEKRQLEGAGDFLTVRFTKPLFRWGAAAICGAAGAISLTELLTDGSYGSQAGTLVVFLVIISAVMFFVAEMFIRKSFRVFKRRIAEECIACVVLLLAGVALLYFDAFGFETYVPQASEVEMATLSGYGSASYNSKEEIEKIIALHEQILSRRSEFKKNESNLLTDEEFYQYIGINYQLKNGSVVSRMYDLQSTDQEFMETLHEQYYSLLSDPEAIKSTYFGMNYEELDWTVVSAFLEYDSGDEDWSQSLYGSQEELQSLYEAVLLDMEAGAFVDFYDDCYNDSDAGIAADTAALTDNEELAEKIAALEAAGTSFELGLELWLRSTAAQEDVQLAGSSNLYFDSGNGGAGTSASCYLWLNSRCVNTIGVLLENGWLAGIEELAY